MYEIFDNRVISITGRDFRYLEKALEFFKEGRFVGYKIDMEKGLVFYWSEYEGVTNFPFTMSIEGIFSFCKEWLKSEECEVIRGSQPDHDGSNEKGWIVYNEEWGHVSNRWEAFCAVKPIWAMYGK